MGNKNSWFKHYNTSSEGQSFELLWAEQDYEAIAFFWWLLEQVSKFESESDRGTCVLSYRILKRKLGWNHSRSARVLSKIGSSFQVKIEPQSDPDLFKVFVPKWSELQENRGGKRDAKPEQKPDRRKKREVRGKNKEIERERFDQVFGLYPIKLEGQKAFERFLEQIETDQDFADLLKSVPNYVAYLSKPENSWRAPKQSFETYLGTKQSGFFWRQWINSDAGTNTLNPASKLESKDWYGTADRIWNLCNIHSYSLSPTMRELLGADLVAVVKASGELYELRSQKKDDFAIKGFAARLKAAHEALSQQAVS